MKIIIVMLLAFMPCLASAIEVNQVFYSLDYSNNTAEVVGCDGELGSATIPATVTDDEGYTYTVTGIGDNAFSGHLNIRSVELPNTIISIGKSAFYKIGKLTYINIPNSVKSIGDDAFSGCGKLSTVSVGRNSTLVSIGSSAFNGCSSLRSFNIPNSVESIGASAFRYCSTISSINIPTSLTSIEAYTFQNTAIQSVTIPNSVTSIGSDAFEYCSELTSVTIGNSVTTIGEYAFRGCSKLISVTIPNSVTAIGGYAFYGCSALNSVTIGDGVTSIGRSAFESCTTLTSLTIGSSVASIGEKAFYKCSALNSLTIPKSVTSIGSSAFYDCTGELTVNCNIPTAYSTYDGSFYGSKFSSVKIGDDVETIGNYAFYYCSGLTSVTIGNSVTSIGSQAFYFCSSLTSLTIGNSVTSIGKEAFSFCSGLTSVTIPKSVTSIGSSAFYNCTGELTVNCNIPNKTSSLFNGSKFSSVKIGDDVETVGDYAFSGCSTLTSVTIGNSVTSIGKDAFYGCSSLTSVTIGNSVKTIGENAFRQISNLTSISFPNSVTTIGKYAFCGCDGLTSVTIPNSVTTIENSAFYSCDGLTSLTIGNSVTSIGDYAFYKCPKLTSVIIPNSVRTIGEYAFYDCSGLTKVVIGKSVTTIGSGAFYKCSALTEIYNYATTPQDITSYEFSNFSATLHVVPGYGDVYRAAYAWKDFQTIAEDATNVGPDDDKPKLSLSASPSGGDVTAGTKVYLTATANSSEVSGVSIYYTLNGTTPSKNSTAYTSSGITINASCTLKAIAYKDGYEDSDVMEESYNIMKPKLSLSASPSGGDVAAGTKVYLTTKADDSAVSGANIYYTLNGTTPSKNSTVYTSSGITINASCTLKAIAYKDGYEDSDVLTTAYNTVTITGITINETNFPDANFRKYLLEQDYGSDGVLTETEIAEITYMDLYGTDIENLKGIGYFKGLEYLSCTGNKLTSLDVSGCSNLRMLYCSLNKLTSLNVSGCSMLNWLYCNDNQLTSLDMSGCPELGLLYVYQNKIKGAAMDAFIKSLPTVSYGFMAVIVGDNEGNVMTVAQVAAAKAKGWTPYYSDGELDDWGGYSWQEYAGSDDGNTPRGTLANPFTPAEANAYGKSLAANEQSEADYYISGVVSNIKEQFGTQYGNATFYISADGSDTDQFYIYRANYLGNTMYAGQELNIRVGDEVIVCGKITNFKGTLPETVEGKAYVVSINGAYGGQGQFGDANGDGTVDVADVVAIVNYILNKPGENFNEKMADVNGDGKIDARDVVDMVSIIKK